jgi:quinol monooxygenase YgiN
MMPIVLVATIVPLAEHRDEVISVLTATIERVHAENGCEIYALHEADNRLVMVEKWENDDALAEHRKGGALAALSRALAGKIAQMPEVITLRPVSAGDPGKGTL